MDRRRAPPLQWSERRGFRIPQAAEYTGLSVWHVAELIRSRRLLALKPQGCRHYVILREDLDGMLDEMREEAVQMLQAEHD